LVHFQLKTRVGADGILSLQVPTGFQETEVEVVIVLEPIRKPDAAATPEALGWPPGFFEETFGSCQDDPLTRLPQGEADIREPIR
jgi:hypothetical protein